jgi:hypothetical protein
VLYQAGSSFFSENLKMEPNTTNVENHYCKGFKWLLIFPLLNSLGFRKLKNSCQKCHFKFKKIENGQQNMLSGQKIASLLNVMQRID